MSVSGMIMLDFRRQLQPVVECPKEGARRKVAEAATATVAD